MRKEAEEHAEVDRQRKELIETRNAGDNAAYAAEKVLKDLGEKVPEDLKNQVNERISSLRAVLNSEDASTIRKATEDLNTVLQQVGAAAYQQPDAGASGFDQSAPPPGGETGQGPANDEDVVDGEFRNA